MQHVYVQQTGEADEAFAASVVLDPMNPGRFAVDFRTPIGVAALDGYATIFEIEQKEEESTCVHEAMCDANEDRDCAEGHVCAEGLCVNTRCM